MNQYNTRLGQKVHKIAKDYFNEVDLISAKDLVTSNCEDPNNYDLILTIGGDGTVLITSHFIKNSKTLLLGINSNP